MAGKNVYYIEVGPRKRLENGIIVKNTRDTSKRKRKRVKDIKNR